MAQYYWTGASGSDVNDRFNWTLFGPGYSAAPPALSKPPSGSNIVFTKWTIPGGVTYPYIEPTGFLYSGNTAAGALPADIPFMRVTGNYDKDLGRGNSYFSFYTQNLLLQKDTTNTTTTRNYLNFVEGINNLGASSDSNLTLDCKSNGLLYTINYISGYLNQIKTGDTQLTKLSTANIFEGGTGIPVTFTSTSPINILNPKSQDSFIVHNTTTFEPNSSLVFKGEGNDVKIFGPLNLTDSSINMESSSNSSSQVLNIMSPGPSGSSGPGTQMLIGTLKLSAPGSQSGSPVVHVSTNTTIFNLRLANGTFRVHTDDNVPVIVRGGYMNNSTSAIVDANGSLTILDSSSYSDGFVVKNPDSLPIAINSPGNHNIRLNPTLYGYTFGNA